MKRLDFSIIKICTMFIVFIYTVIWANVLMAIFVYPETLHRHPDFWVFYAGGLLASEGKAVSAYDVGVVYRTFKELYPHLDQVLGWYYPPTFFFIAEILASVSYPISYVLWNAFTAAFFFWTILPLTKNAEEWWLVLAAPAVFLNAVLGQNAFLTAGLLALAYRYLMTHQIVAGVAVGLLCVKPHLGILLPVAMIAYRRWTAIMSAAATVTVIVLASAARYGVEVWQIFFTDNMNLVSQWIFQGHIRWGGMSSIYVLGLSIGLSPYLAMGLQVLFTLGVMLCILYMVHRQVPYRLVMVFLLAAILPASPHNYSYDWVILVLPMLLFWHELEATNIVEYEKIILAAMFITPFFLLIIYNRLGWEAPFGVFVILALLFIILRRSFTRGVVNA